MKLTKLFLSVCLAHLALMGCGGESTGPQASANADANAAAADDGAVEADAVDVLDDGSVEDEVLGSSGEDAARRHTYCSEKASVTFVELFDSGGKYYQVHPGHCVTAVGTRTFNKINGKPGKYLQIRSDSRKTLVQTIYFYDRSQKNLNNTARNGIRIRGTLRNFKQCATANAQC